MAHILKGGRRRAAALTLATCIGVSLPAYSQSTTPIASYNFEEGGGSSLTDRSGNNHPGTLTNGPVWSGGKYGGGLAFDGINDYVTMGDVAQADGLSSFTVSVWVKFNSAGGGSMETHLVDKSRCDGYTDGGPWELGVSLTSTRKAEFLVYPQYGSPAAYIFSGPSSTSVDDGSWHYISGRYDGTTISIWVDGRQENSVSAPGLTLSNSTNKVQLGGRCNGYAYPFKGTLDDVRIYNRALTAVQLTADMNTPIDGGGGSAGDVTPPTIVITAPAQSATVAQAVSVAATASDNIGVAGVRFLLDGATVGVEDTVAPYAISWNTLTASNGAHTLSAIARDAAGNTTSSAPVTVTVTNDATAPSPPSNLSAGTISTSSVALSWSAATDNVAVTGYAVYRGSVQVGTTATLSLVDSGLNANTTYTYTVRAYDAAGNTSGASSPLAVTTAAPPAGDSTPPSVPLGLSSSGVTASQATIAWQPSTDNVGVTGYRVYRNGALVATRTTTSYTNTGLSASTAYSFTVTAFDAAGNTSVQSNPLPVTTASASDVTPPSRPAGLSASGITSTQITISWQASTDNVGVTGYRVFRNGASVGTTSTTNFTNTGLAPNTTYSFTVAAFDAAGNNSLESAALSANTSASSGASYSTNFDLNERPISEGGVWHRANNPWTNVQTTGGVVFGTNGVTGNYDDSYALLSGFGPDQTAQAVIYRNPSLSPGGTHEVELLLRARDDANNVWGYECLFAYFGGVQIMRWDGDFGGYVALDVLDYNSLGRDLVSGDVIKATMIGNVIRLYINDIPMGRAIDSTYKTGQPGISFFVGGGDNPKVLGLTSYSVSSQ